MTERYYSFYTDTRLVMDALFQDMRDGIREEALEKDCKVIKVVHMTL